MSTTMSNPLLDDLDAFPHITVTLPTMGLFYDENVFKEGTDPSVLEAHPFSMWEEVHHSNPFAIMSGKATRRMINTVAPEVNDPDALCGFDVDIIMLAGRLASYGEEMKLTMTCANPEPIRKDPNSDNETLLTCDAKRDMVVNVKDIINNYHIIDNIDDWQLDLSNGQCVYLRPSLYKDILQALKISVSQEKINQVIRRYEDLPEDKMIEMTDKSVDNLISVKLITMVSSIMCVETADKSRKIKERELIVQWLEKLNPEYVSMIQDKLNELVQPFEKTGKVSYICDECGYENKDINLIQDQSRFFTRG